MANRGNITISIDVEGKEAVNEFDRLYKKTQELKTGVKNLNNENKEYRQQIKELRADLKTLTKGTEEYAATKSKIDALTNSIKQNNTEAAKLVKTQGEVNAQLEETRQKLGLNELTFKQLKTEVSRLAKELNELIPGTEAFINKSEELKTVAARYNQVKSEIDGFTSKLREAPSTFDKAIGKVKEFAVAIGLAFGLDKIREFFAFAISETARFSDKYADIQKTSGQNIEEVRKLGKELEALNTRTSDADLLDIAKIGGQIGIVKEQLKGFTEEVDKAVVALGDEFTGGAEEVASKMGTLKTLFQETKDIEAGDAINKIGSAVNELGASGTATGPVITEFATRIGQLPGNIAPALSETLGLGATLQELGFTAEIASGGLTNVFLTGAKNAKPFAAQLGITEKEFKKAFNEDSNAVILRLADSLKGLSDTQVADVLKKLGIDSQESVKVLGALANNTDKVREKQALANKAMQEGTSLTKEFNVKNNTLQADLDKAAKNTARFAREVGEVLAPAVRFVSNAFSGFLDLLRATPKFLQDNIVSVILLSTAYIAYTLEVNRARLATLANTIADKAGAIQKGISATATYAYNTAIKIFTGQITLATIATRAFNLVMKLNPVGLVVTAVGLLIAGLVALYQNFEGFRSVVNGSVAAIGAVFGKVYDSIKALFSFDFQALYGNIMSIGSAAEKAYTEAANAEAKAREKAKQDRINARKKEADDFVKEAKKEEQAALKELEDANKEKKNIEDAANKEQLDKQKELSDKLLEKQKEYDEKALEARRKLEDLKIELIADANERERAKIELDAKRRVEDAQKEIKELEKLQALGIRIDPQAIPNIKSQIELIQKEAQNKLDEVQLKQTIQTLNTQEAQAKETLITETVASGGDESKILEARQRFNKESLRINEEKINEELKQLDRSNETELLKVQELETQKAELRQQASDSDIQTGLALIDQKYAVLSEQEEIKFLEQTGTQEELRKQILDENFSSFLEAEAEREQALFDLQQAKLEERLKLLIDSGQAQSSEARKLNLDILKNQVAHNKQIVENEKKTAELKKKLALESLQVTSDTFQLGVDLLGQDEKARKKNASAIKAFTIGKILSDLAIEISGYFTTVDSVTTLGATGAIKAAIATARALISIRNVGSQQFALGGLLKNTRRLTMSQDNKGTWNYANGGMVRNAGVLQGPSHAQGGLSVFDNRSGRQVAEFEGGEPAMILSKNTYSNNKGLIDSLLYSSLYKNGAPVRYQSGGLLSDFTNPQPSSSAAITAGTIDTNNDFILLLQEIREMKEIIANQQTILRAYVVYQDLQESQTTFNNLVNKNSLGGN